MRLHERFFTRFTQAYCRGYLKALVQEPEQRGLCRATRAPYGSVGFNTGA